MDALHRLRRLFRIGIIAAAALLAAAAGLIVFRESQFDRLQDEHEAVREMAILVERYVETGSVPALPPAVAGFGLYDATGEAIIAAGRAPDAIRPPRDGDVVDRQGGMLRLIRPVGGVRSAPGIADDGTGPLPGGRGPGTTAEPMQRGLRRMPGFVSQYVLLEYDLSVPSRQRAWERGALVLAGILTVGVLAIVVILYRRLQGASQRAEEQRRLAQLGEAARTLAHEIKNPLTAAQMQTALLRRTTDPEAHPRIAVIDEELARIRGLTDQVREFLKSGSGRPEPIAALPEIREIAGRLGIDVETVGDDAQTVAFDRDRFQSVVGNLLRNAREADESGAPIRVELAARRGRVTISVADRGPGIPADERTRVFDPFFTTKAHGSGVGLAITQRFVDDAGGEIAVEDRAGGGTVVILTLKGSER